MADVLAGLFAGMAKGKKANADRAAAEAKARQKEAEWQLKLAAESRLLQGAAEDEWQEMESATTSDKWDPSMLPSLLDRAMRFDNTYGKVWRGKSAFKYFGEAMHANPVKAPGAMDKGVPGPQPEATEVMSPMAGFRSPAQKGAADKLAREMRTAEVMPHIRADLEKILSPMRSAGMLDPTRAYGAIQKYEAEIVAKYNLDPLEVEKVVDDVEAALADTFAEIFRQQGKGEDYQKEFGQASQRLSTWLRQSMGLKEDAFDFERQFAAKAPAIMRIEQFMQRKIAAGAPENMIKWEAIQRYRDETGNWDLDPASMPHFVELSQAPDAVRRAAEALYADGTVSDEQMEPVRDDTGSWFLVSPATGKRVKFWPATEGVGMLAPNGRAPEGATAEDGGRKYRKVNGTWEPVEDAQGN